MKSTVQLQPLHIKLAPLKHRRFLIIYSLLMEPLLEPRHCSKVWTDKESGSLPTPCAASWGNRRRTATVQRNALLQRLPDKYCSLEAHAQQGLVPGFQCALHHKDTRKGGAGSPGQLVGM